MTCLLIKVQNLGEVLLSLKFFLKSTCALLQGKNYITKKINTDWNKVDGLLHKKCINIQTNV